MARRRGLMASLAQIQRDAARAEAARRRAQAASQRAAEQARVRYERAAAADERECKRLYADSRTAEVAAMNAELADTLAALDGVLAATLDVDNFFDLDQLKKPTDLGRLAIPEPPPSEATFLPAAPSGLSRMLGGSARHEDQLRTGRARYHQARAEHAAREGARRAALAQADADNRQRAEDVEALRRDLAAAVPRPW